MMEAETAVMGSSEPRVTLSPRACSTVSRLHRKRVQSGPGCWPRPFSSPPVHAMAPWGGREDRAPWVGSTSQQHLLPRAFSLWTGNQRGGCGGRSSPGPTARLFQMAPGSRQGQSSKSFLGLQGPRCGRRAGQRLPKSRDLRGAAGLALGSCPSSPGPRGLTRGFT